MSCVACVAFVSKRVRPSPLHGIRVVLHFVRHDSPLHRLWIRVFTWARRFSTIRSFARLRPSVAHTAIAISVDSTSPLSNPMYLPLLTPFAYLGTTAPPPRSLISGRTTRFTSIASARMSPRSTSWCTLSWTSLTSGDDVRRFAPPPCAGKSCCLGPARVFVSSATHRVYIGLHATSTVSPLHPVPTKLTISDTL